MNAARRAWLIRALAGGLGAIALAGVADFAFRRASAEYEAADAAALLEGDQAGAGAAGQAEAEAARARALEPDRMGSSTLVARAMVRGALASGLLTADGRGRLASASELLQAQLAGQPDDGEAWLWLAYVESLLNGGRADDLVRHALRRSYESLPYPPSDLLLWRTQFAANLWPGLDPELRGMVLERISAAWAFAGARDDVEALSQQVTDPAGRTAIGLRLLALQEGDRRRRPEPAPAIEPPAATQGND